MLSIIIPARNESYLQNTIDDILKKARGSIEIICVLDGYWPVYPIEDKKNVHVIHFSDHKGMRKAINAGVYLARGEYILKCDGHVAFQEGFDTKLVRDYKPKMVMVPQRYGLDVDTWERTDKKVDFQYIERGTLKGRKWPDYPGDGKIIDLMTTQGSCWFMSRAWYDEIGGIDDINYGMMGREAQEVCLKTWTMGGRMVLTRNTWYAHWDKPKEHVIGGVKAEKEKSLAYALSVWTEEKIYPVIERFTPVPSWNNVGRPWEEIGIGIEPAKPAMGRRDIYTLFAEKGYKLGAEIGVWDGVNAAAMFERIPGLKLHLVDPYYDYPTSRKRRGETRLMTSYRRMNERMKGRDFVMWKMMSEDTARRFEDGSLDFIYIDGNHKFDFAMLDILLWERKVRPGGIVAGHDYFDDIRKGYGVKTAVDAYCSMHPEVKLNVTDPNAEPHAKHVKAVSWWFEKP